MRGIGMLARPHGRQICMGVTGIVGIAVALAGCEAGIRGDGEPEDTTTTVSYDAINREWNQSIERSQAQTGSPSNTIVVQLNEREPVREIILSEVLLVDSPSEPTLEIHGQDDLTTGSSGRVIICELKLRKVDAEELRVANTKITQLAALNVALDEQEIQVDPVNVVRCGRGGVAVVALGGLDTEDDIGILDTRDSALLVLTAGGNAGFRANRIRILGPPGKDGFVEKVLIERTSVFGQFEINQAAVKRLVLETVTIDRDPI